MNYCVVRLGKDSVDTIKHIDTYKTTTNFSDPTNAYGISVTCAQLPDVKVGDTSFIWFGSDSGKGQKPDWDLGLRAIGEITSVERAEWREKSTIKINITDILSKSLGRDALLISAKDNLPGIINFPVMGVNSYANQTVQQIDDGQPGQSVEALLRILKGEVGLNKNLATVPYTQEGHKIMPIIARVNFHLTLANPFLILAGPSGTGKSRWVIEQAFLTWKGNQEPNAPPPNYQLIPVKPNWHDSSELLGYVTRLGVEDGQKARYIVTDFVRFLVRAWQNPNSAHWLCLDEMNLAPVEQYFAEYLSVVETRRVDATIPSITSAAIVTKATITELLDSKDLSRDTKEWVAFCADSGVELGSPLANQIRANGLALPSNLIIVGTVNMDETTHSFSRKVLDRAFVWELSIGDLSHGWEPLGYPDTPIDWQPLPATEGSEAKAFLGDLDAIWQGTQNISDAVVQWLKDINSSIEGTPFQVSYRVRDELLLLVASRGVTTVEGLMQTLDDGLYSKVLPRIEGDEHRTKRALLGLLSLLFRDAQLSELPGWSKVDERLKTGKYIETIPLDLILDAEHGPGFMFNGDDWKDDPFAPALPWRRSINKIRTMLLRLEGQFTSYWD